MKQKNQRFELIQKMNELEATGFGCKGCQGHCCTFEANSMMITPLETLDILAHLENENLKINNLKIKLLETIKKFRLDQVQGNGKKIFLRRTYTCPFFESGELGCPLPREIKPYGCLAFNSHHEKFKASEHCFSDKVLLENLERENSPSKFYNQKLKEVLCLNWEKQTIPMALIEMWDLEANVLMAKILN